MNQAELRQYVVETLEELGIDYMIGLKRRPLFQTGRACFFRGFTSLTEHRNDDCSKGGSDNQCEQQDAQSVFYVR